MKKLNTNNLARRVLLVATAALLVGVVAGVAVASGGEGHHVDSGVLLKDFLYRCLNFAVMFGLLAYFLTKPIRRGMAARREGIEKSLQDAKAAQDVAEAMFVEYDRKLSKAAAEITEIRESIRREGETERDRIVANAREMAAKIKIEAEKAADNEIIKACAELRREAARLAIAMAEELLTKNFTGADHERLVNEYLQKVGELH